MGSRANYLVVKDGRIEIFYSNWGAQTLIADMFWGPEYAEHFIRKNVEADRLLAETWAEAGAVLDKDSRTLVWFSSGDDNTLHQLAFEFMKYIWGRVDWRVEKRSRLSELAECVGMDADIVKDPLRTPEIVDLDASDHLQFSFFSIVSLFTLNMWQHYVTGKEMAGLLMNGPILLNYVEQMTPLYQRLSEGYEGDISRGALYSYVDNAVAINVPLKNLVARGVDFYRVDPDAMERVWPNWRVCLHDDFDDEYIVQHFRYVGEDMPEILAGQSGVENKPLEAQLRELHELVFSSDDTKRRTAEFFTRVISKLETEYGESLNIAPGADKAIISESPSLSLKQQLFEEVAEHIRQLRQNAT